MTDETRSADALADSDYSRAFDVTVASAGSRSPEQWARNIFEDAPSVLRGLVLIGRRAVLGLRLGPRTSPDYVLRWKIVTRASDAVTLEPQSALMTARKVVRVEGSHVIVTTSVNYERPLGRVVWSLVRPVHRVLEPRFLARVGH